MFTVGLIEAVTVCTTFVHVMFWKVGERTDVGATVFCVTTNETVFVHFDTGCSPVTTKVPCEFEKVITGLGPNWAAVIWFVVV